MCLSLLEKREDTLTVLKKFIKREKYKINGKVELPHCHSQSAFCRISATKFMLIYSTYLFSFI